MGIVWACGFEQGSLGVFSYYRNDTYLNTSVPRTGGYCVEFGRDAEAYVDLPAGYSELYLSFGLYPVVNTWYDWQLQVYLEGASSSISLRLTAYPHRFAAFVGGTLVAQGTQLLPTASWSHAQLHVICADAGGIIQAYVNGVLDIDYSGDTQSGSSALLNRLRFLKDIGSGISFYIDDVMLRDDAWPGDARAHPLLPNGDSSVAWSRSGGTTNYENVDERPPSDDDYVYTSTDGARDLYTLQDLSASGNIVAVSVWGRAWKDVADGSQLKLLARLGANETSATYDLALTPTYRTLHMLQKPGGGAWSDSDVDNLLVGLEADIV